MGNRKPKNVTWSRSCGRVCSLQVKFARQEGLQAVSVRFFVTKNCTASLVKARGSFLYPPKMCLLDVLTRINKLIMFLGR